MTNSTTLGFMISLKMMMMMVVGVLNFSVAQQYSAQWKLSHSKNFLTSGSSVLFWGVFDVHGIWGTPCLSAWLKTPKSSGWLLFFIQGAYRVILLVCLESRLRRWTMLLYRALCQWGASWLMSNCAIQSRYLTHSSVQLCANWDARWTSSLCHRSHI